MPLRKVVEQRINIAAAIRLHRRLRSQVIRIVRQRRPTAPRLSKRRLRLRIAMVERVSMTERQLRRRSSFPRM